MALRAFPVIYAREVEAVATFYERLGFQERFRMPAEGGSAGFIRLERYGAELGVTTEESPRTLAGIVREPANNFWGERLAYVADPEGNLVVLAGARIT